MLLRVPGLGVRSARRIMAARRVQTLRFEDLKKLGVVLKRARYFLTAGGKYHGDAPFREDLIRQSLLARAARPAKYEQLAFFTEQDPVHASLLEEAATRITGEL